MAGRHRIAIGLSIFGFGSALFLEIPLTRGSDAIDLLARVGISLGALIAFMGLGILMDN